MPGKDTKIWHAGVKFGGMASLPPKFAYGELLMSMFQSEQDVVKDGSRESDRR